MFLAFILTYGQAFGDRGQLDVRFSQIAPTLCDSEPFDKTSNRAVVLVPGLRAHPFSTGHVSRAEWHSWQTPGSLIVQTLAKDADVFALAYSQNAAVEEIARTAPLARGIAALKRMGYRDIVLMGHSAGGLVARQFVEDNPTSGVTKVIQVCSPNAGTRWGTVNFAVREPQQVFLNSLSKQSRKDYLAERAEKTIPRHVDFVCVVGQVKLPESPVIQVGGKQLELNVDSSRLRGDGLISAASQWPDDLQMQGIPAVLLSTTHFTVMKSQSTATRLTELIRESHPRWTATQVETARRRVLGD